MRTPRFALGIQLAGVLAAGPEARAQDGGDKGGAPAGDKGGAPAYKGPNDRRAQLPVRINQAIDSGVAWLKKQTGAAGNWCPEITAPLKYDPNSKGDPICFPTGCTSLSLYALLKSGVPKDDPVVVKAFKWLRAPNASVTKGKGKVNANQIPSTSYEIAALILALEAKANPHKREAELERELKFKVKKGEKLKTGVKLDPEDQPWMKSLVDELKKRQVGGAGWRYGFFNGKSYDNGVRGDKDLSASQLSMLAIAAAERCGFKQDDSFYVNVLEWTLSMQEKDGPEVKRWDPTIKEEDARYGLAKDHARGFGYLGASSADKEHIASGSMTCCGLANIIICTATLEARDSKLYTGDLESRAEKGWWDGIAWLHFFWSVKNNTNCSQGYLYYYLYCMERACDLKRINLIAGRPWYNLGAQVLVDDQLVNTSGGLPDGSWTLDDTHQPHDILNTCFALLFLNRATPAITGGD